METIVELFEDPDKALPTMHRFGKLMVGVIAGFAAKHYAEKAYLAALECRRIKKAIKA